MRLTLIVALVFGACSPALAADNAPRGGALSGLTWASGASAGHDPLQNLRGRTLDVRTAFLNHQTWSGMITSAGWLKQARAGGARAIVAFGMMPETHRGQHAQCANGVFDTYMRQLGTKLVASGGADAVLRLGWEANRMGGFPWAATGDGASYKACFRRWVRTLRSVTGQKFTIDWNMGRQGNLPYSVAQLYPGNDVVDVVGVQLYDTCPPSPDEATWTKNQNATRNGGPAGAYTWLAFAKGKGKRLSVPEWGVGGSYGGCKQPSFDNPFFIRKMHEFFKANAGSIAYEAYLNGPGVSRTNPQSHPSTIAPTDPNPKSAAEYAKLWGSVLY